MTHKIILLFLGLQMFWSPSVVAKLNEKQKKHLDTLYSFEDGLIPDFIKFKHKELVQSTTEYSQDQQKSLEWKPRGNDSFRVRIGKIGDPFGASGANNYYRSAFRIAIRSHDKGGTVHVTLKGKGGREIAGVDVPMVYDGWQNLIYHYSSHPKFDRYAGKDSLKDITHLVVSTSRDYPKGTPLYIDSLRLNYHVEWRQFITKRDPKAFYKRVDILNDFEDPRIKGLDKSILAPPTKEELAGLALIKSRSLGDGATRGGWTTKEQVEGAWNHYKYKFGLYRNKDGVARGHADWYIHVSHEMREVARSYVPTAPAEVRDSAEELFILLNDFLREMGAKLNGLYAMNNYIGRAHSDAVISMHKVLRKHGRLKGAVRKMEQDYRYNDIFNVPASQFNMDHYHNEVRYRIAIALLQDTIHEQVIHLRVLQKVISQQILADGVLQVDGSLYHHGMNYYSYGGQGLAGLGRVIGRFGGTPFQISKEAFDKYTNIVMMMRWYSNTTDLPLTLHGRSPGGMSIPSTHLNTAVTYSADFNEGKIDPKLAAAYLRILKIERARTKVAHERERNGQKKSHLYDNILNKDSRIEDLEAQGFKAEKAPEGNRTMPYAGTSMHRRGEWLAHVRGFGAGLKAFETYGASGRFNLFIANGYLDIYSSGNAITGISGHASGYRPWAGWDWRYLDGTTSILMPYEKMSFGKNNGSDGSPEPLAGGLSHRGWNGVFSMPLRSSLQQRKAMKKGGSGSVFQANKSYFFFDNRIVCLGSDVRLKDSNYEVITTLFQKALDKENNQKFTTIDGQKIDALEFLEERETRRNKWLIDPYGTGYYIPSGQTLKVVHSKQNSRTGNDGAATEGYYAKAYFSHGKKPKKAGYSYIALVKTDAEKMEAFYEAMKIKSTAPVRIVAKDKKKHVVFDRPTKSWGAVFYKKQNVSHSFSRYKFPIRFVDQACLVMAEHKDNGELLLTLSRPDFRDAGGTISVDLVSGWKLSPVQEAELPEDFKVERGKITLPIVHGRSYTISFEGLRFKGRDKAVAKIDTPKKKKTIEEKGINDEAKDIGEGEEVFNNEEEFVDGEEDIEDELDIVVVENTDGLEKAKQANAVETNQVARKRKGKLSEKGVRQLKMIVGGFAIVFLIWILYLFNRKP